MRRLILAAATLMLAGAGPPAAPTLAPERDVVVAYHLAPANGEAINVLVSFQAGGRMLRMDLPDETYVVAEMPTEMLMLVVPAQHTIADLPWTAGPQPLFLFDPAWAFVRKGEATVAGEHCVQWEATKDPAHHQACITPDGVALRNVFQDQQGKRNLVEALGVRRMPLQPEVFNAPLGYQRFQPMAPQAPIR